MTSRSQDALILLAITFTSLMGLMGYARSGIREDWHVYGVMRDTSVDAYTPTLGDASNIIAAIVFIFFAMLVFVFWLGSIGENRKDVVSEESKSPPSSAEIDSP
jgi:cytochrome bd-type quinol oxidase subunit 1